MTKGEPTSKIDIVQAGKEYNISIDDVKQVFKSNWEIPSIEKVDWDISNVINMYGMFNNCPIEEKYKPKFK